MAQSIIRRSSARRTRSLLRGAGGVGCSAGSADGAGVTGGPSSGAVSGVSTGCGGGKSENGIGGPRSVLGGGWRRGRHRQRQIGLERCRWSLVAGGGRPREWQFGHLLGPYIVVDLDGA